MPMTLAMDEMSRSEVEPLSALPFPLEERSGRPHVCVVVPVYNEQRLVEPLYERVRASLDGLDATWTLLYVNDGSRDETIAQLERLHAADERVSYVLLSRNFGHQSAL